MATAGDTPQKHSRKTVRSGFALNNTKKSRAMSVLANGSRLRDQEDKMGQPELLRDSSETERQKHFESLRNLYWLAYVLTGDRELSVQAVEESLEVQNPLNPFFGSWMVTWSRKVFIAKLLSGVSAEIEASRLRTKALSSRISAKISRDSNLDRLPGRAGLEQALLAIDLFPRCAVVLRVFERLSLEDVAVLLGADQALVAAAQATGLMELVQNFTGGQAPRSANYFSAAYCLSN